jgi:hypothetical protein
MTCSNKDIITQTETEKCIKVTSPKDSKYIFYKSIM